MLKKLAIPTIPMIALAAMLAIAPHAAKADDAQCPPPPAPAYAPEPGTSVYAYHTFVAGEHAGHHRDRARPDHR